MPVYMEKETTRFSFISNELQYDVKSCKQLTPVQSDHSPIVLHISSVSEQTRGRRYWKFNNSLTEDKDFVEKLRTYINDVKSTFNEHQDSRISWEFLKYKIQRFSNRYTLEQAKKRKARQKALESRLQELEQRIVDTEFEIENIIDDYKNTKAEFEQIHNHIGNGIILRSKVRWDEECEKNNKYFWDWENETK